MRLIFRSKQGKGLAQLVLASVFSGTIPILTRYGSGINPYFLTFAQTAVTALAIFLYLIIFKRSLPNRLKYEKKKMLLFGGIHGFIILGFFIALKLLDIASAVLLLYTGPIWIIIFSHYILKERITKRTVISIIIAIIGVIIILSPTSFFLKESAMGTISALFAGVGFGLVYVLSKTFKKYDKVSLTFWQNLIALPFILPLVFIGNLPQFTLTNVSVIIGLGVIGHAIPFVLIFKGFAKIKAQMGGVFVLLDILFPILFGFIIFHESLSDLTIIGGAMIILGVVISSLKG